MVNPADIGFNEDDKNLFQVDDRRLRADALRHSVLPRLHVVMNESIATIQRIYDIDVLEDSIIGFHPQFRTKRNFELKLLYDSAGVSLAGKRTLGKWHGVQRRDNKKVQIVPYRYGIELTNEGLTLYLTNQWMKGLTEESQQKLFDFHVKFQNTVYLLSHISGFTQILFWQSLALNQNISDLKQYYDYMYEINSYENDFVSGAIPYPITVESLFGKTYALSNKITSLVLRFACFYPVYESYIQIAKDEPVRIDTLFGKLKQELARILEDEQEYPDDSQQSASQQPELAQDNAKQAAEAVIRVMPALRWQVFQRDNWKCVACGRGSEDGIILHVDHIIPRSKGGLDSLNNYQTLCHICNIGKSNKDSTDLRLLAKMKSKPTKQSL